MYFQKIYLFRKYTTTAHLILLMSAFFFARNQRFLAKIVSLLKTVV